MDRMKIFSGNANLKLAKNIVNCLGVKLGDAEVSKFQDEEIKVKVNENVRGKHVFIIQPTCPPVNNNLSELLIMTDTFKRASAEKITAVMPYFGYARQDRKDEGRTPISAKLMADVLTVAGVTRVITIDLHASQIQGFFNIPVDPLYAINVFVEYVKKLEIENLVFVSPDTGGVKRARAYAEKFNTGLAIIDKRRERAEHNEVMNVIGEIEGKTAFMIDDIVGTGGTLIKAANALLEKGAKEVFAFCTHPVLSGDAAEKIKNSAISQLIVTDTIPLDKEKRNDKIKVLSVAELLGKAILNCHKNKSISMLFK